MGNIMKECVENEDVDLAIQMVNSSGYNNHSYITMYRYLMLF